MSPQHQLLDHGSLEGDPARGWTTAPSVLLVSLLEPYIWEALRIYAEK